MKDFQVEGFFYNSSILHADFVMNYTEMRRDPFVSTHRAFTQWSYASKPKSKGQQFRVDGVLQWVGSQELPAQDSQGRRPPHHFSF